jgi:hypothetical protein
LRAGIRARPHSVASVTVRPPGSAASMNLTVVPRITLRGDAIACRLRSGHSGTFPRDGDLRIHRARRAPTLI